MSQNLFALFTADGLSSGEFNLQGGYYPGAEEVRFDFLFDAVKQTDHSVDLESLFADQLQVADRIQEMGISLGSEMAFTSTLGLMLD